MKLETKLRAFGALGDRSPFLARYEQSFLETLGIQRIFEVRKMAQSTSREFLRHRQRKSEEKLYIILLDFVNGY